MADREAEVYSTSQLLGFHKELPQMCAPVYKHVSMEASIHVHEQDAVCVVKEINHSMLQPLRMERYIDMHMCIVCLSLRGFLEDSARLPLNHYDGSH